MKRALVVSGGGSKGAYAGGIIENLIKKKGLQWDILVGTSTGSMLVPSTSIGDIDKLKNEYTTITNDSIFSVSPFKQNGKLRILNALKRIVMGKNSIGEASKLRKKIEQIFTVADFNKAIELNKDVYVCVSNITTCKAEFKKMSECKYEDFCDWMLASASVPIGFEVVEKEGYQYLDGGLFHMIPIQKAIDDGADEIDIIVLKEKDPKPDKWVAKNIFNVFMRIIDMMNMEIGNDDIEVAKILGVQKSVKLNFYYLPYKLTDNSIVFNKEEMLKWWDLGYNFDVDSHGDTMSDKALLKNNIKSCRIIKK